MIIKFLYRREKKCPIYKKNENETEKPNSYLFGEILKDEDCMVINEFKSIASQMLVVPFKVIYEDPTSNKKKNMI